MEFVILTKNLKYYFYENISKNAFKGPGVIYSYTFTTSYFPFFILNFHFNRIFLLEPVDTILAM